MKENHVYCGPIDLFLSQGLEGQSQVEVVHRQGPFLSIAQVAGPIGAYVGPEHTVPWARNSRTTKNSTASEALSTGLSAWKRLPLTCWRQRMIAFRSDSLAQVGRFQKSRDPCGGYYTE